MITEGELLAGTRLNERTLGVRLGVSRTPLREAFRLLAADGLIELTPNRGAQVVSLSEQDIRDSFEVMSGLEALSGELACRHVTADEIAEIKALTFEMLDSTGTWVLLPSSVDNQNNVVTSAVATTGEYALVVNTAKLVFLPAIPAVIQPGW